LEGASREEVTHEGYGPATALYIEGSTDNANRTVAEIRHALDRNGAKLAATNSVAYLFDRKGQLAIDAGTLDEDKAMEDSLESGADDFERDGDQFIVSTSPAGLHAVQAALKARGYAVTSAEIAMVPKNLVKVDGPDVERVIRLIDALEELDDVSKVFSNLDIDASALAEADA
jgi:YebC/PmpR family DNA-binding regulatory protein